MVSDSQDEGRSVRNDDGDEESTLPIPIQTFLWRQTCPFIRPKLGKLHEATCVEIREACKSLEKVLVQNIQFGLSPSLTEAIKSISRWRIIQTAFPHVVHCVAQLLTNRKMSGIQSGLGAAETKLLYTLHWILLDSPEECADADFEKGYSPHNPFHYLFPIASITVRKWSNLFEVGCGFQLRIWPSLWAHKAPEAVCFSCPVKPKNTLDPYFVRKGKKDQFGDIFVGQKQDDSLVGKSPDTSGIAIPEDIQTATPPPTPEHARHDLSTNLVMEDEIEKALPAAVINNSGSSPAAPFPETIPEESSSNEEEHVMIFRLGSIPDSEALKEGTLFRMTVPHRQGSSESSKTSPSPSDRPKDRKGSNESQNKDSFAATLSSSPRPSISPGNQTVKSETDKRNAIGVPRGLSRGESLANASLACDKRLATYMDVAVLRCMFIPHWEEEGVYWGTNFLLKRFEEITQLLDADETNASASLPKIPRSKSLPTLRPKQRVKLGAACYFFHDSRKDSEYDKLTPLICGKDFNSTGSGKNKFISYSACSSPLAQRRGGDSRRASEKGSKKKLTMMDLKTLIETKILSRSEKMLERVGGVGPNVESTENGHDEEEHSRPISSMGNYEEPEKTALLKKDEHESPPQDFNDSTNLFKGKSMPSLSCLLVDDLAAPTGYCGVTHLPLDPTKTAPPMINNPIITVTEHTPCPTPSPDAPYRRRASSLESQINLFNQTGQYNITRKKKKRKNFLVRSYSDTLVTYRISECPEAAGTAQYITPSGSLDVKVVFNALFHVCSRDTIIKSVRVANTVLSLISTIFSRIKLGEDALKIFDCITRIIGAVGCAHGCGEAQKSTQSETARASCQSLLLKLAEKFKEQFEEYYRNFIAYQNLTVVLKFFHSLCAFCYDAATMLSPTNRKIQDFYSNLKAMEENASTKSKIEVMIFKVVFKRLVTRLCLVSKDLRSTENMHLYCEVRLLVNYVYENDGNTFRKVALSALLDSIDRPNKRDSSNRQMQTTRILRRMLPSDEPQGYFMIDETSSGGPQSGGNNKKGFFKKKSSSSTCASVGGETDNTGESPSGTLSRKHAILTPKSSELELIGKKSFKKESRLVSWLTRSGGSGGMTGGVVDRSSDNDVPGSPFGEFSTSDINEAPASAPMKRTPRQATIVQKAKKRVEERLRKIRIKRDSSNDDSFVGASSRRGSLENIANENFMRESGSEFVEFKERRIVNPAVIKEGLLRFSFLLEITQPGALPDSGLMAALLDLPKTVVVARACMMMECSYLVHACNRGHWPVWMKFPIFRPSCAGMSKPLGSRSKSYGLQRATGKLFHQWGEALNARLEEFVTSNREKMAKLEITDEGVQKDLAQKEEEEDFLDEASITDGSECPLALQILACMLLYEVTAFIRETYQTLPKVPSSAHASKMTSETKDVVPAAAGSKAAPSQSSGPGGASRRWSYGLSSMGQSQASHSLQSIADQTHPPQQAPPATGERKISFVLNDNESSESAEHKAHTPTAPSNAAGNDSDAADDKKGKKLRPLLLRRGTPSGGQGSSFRRRSIKLNKPKDHKKDGDNDSIKRSDSLTSGKRKVSSISDDTSEQNSGDESPGVNSNDDNLAHPTPPTQSAEEQLHMPWISTIISFLSTLHYRCSHQMFCHPMCPRKLMRSVSRLLKSIRKVYGEEFGILTDSRDLFPTDNCPKSKDRLDEPVVLKYIKNQVQGGFHPIFSTLIKAASTLTEDQFVSVIPITWELILEPDIQVSSCSCALFTLAGVKASEQVKRQLEKDFESSNPSIRIRTLLKFMALWKNRYHIWPRMEENTTFRAPLPGIDFTLPSPRIGVESIPVVDPPWMPETKAKVEEVALNQDPQVSRRYLVTATKTRKTQQAELVKMALQAEEDKKKTERESFLITTISITKQASYEPSLHHAVGEDEADEENANAGQSDGKGTSSAGISNPTSQPGPSSEGVSSGFLSSKGSHSKTLALFPSSLCSSSVFIVQLLDDPAVTIDGNAVYEVAYQVLWTCLVDDCSLFLRYVFEKLTRGQHELMFKILRHLILFVPRLPQQAAFSLYNHIIGFIMYHTRSPQDSSPEMIGSALSVLWMVVHSVQGIMFKDLKQILRKEQCDASIMLTANVPAAKKIVVHGPLDPEAVGIPTQFPVQEDTQFVQILREAYDFFSIDEEHHKEYFLMDQKTHQIHNPNAYVRDFYFFSRAQHPHISLVHMPPDHAYNALQRQSFILKFVEIGKVTLTWAILKNVDQVMQRVVFLHEELMKLPSFPRKALETDLDICRGGLMGRELLGLDVLHKFMWVKLVTRMFEAMSGNYVYSGDVHLFINVLSGALMVHSEDATIIRYVTASFINAAQQFKNIFSRNGYLLVMPPLLLTYSNHQSNALVTEAVEFACKQFYLLHRKPFVLQMFGALAALLDTDDQAQYGDPTRVPSKCLFRLLLSLETPTPDPLHITELIHGPQPLRPLDFCYKDDSDEITVLDCISMCVCVVSYAADSLRGQQMLTILEAVLPPYLNHIQTNKTEGKTERDIINHIAVAMKTLVNNCEPLAKNYSGPQISGPSDPRSSSQRNYASKGGLLSPGFDFADDDSHSKYMSDHSKNKNAVYDREAQDSEFIREEFRRPRDTLLSLVSDFYSTSSNRLPELAKKGGAEAKPVELLDTKSHTRLADVAISLLKVSPYDPATMACRGLQRYMVEVLPYGDWIQESTRASLTAFLRRLDKTFMKICKKTSIRRHSDWEAAAGILKGVYQTLWRHPYIVHNQHLKSLVTTCQCLILGEGQSNEIGLSAAGAALMAKIPPAHFCSTVVRLIALQTRALGDFYSLEQACGTQMPAPPEKTDSLLLHLLLPMCLRVGTGRKDVPKMRKADVIYIINVILSSITPMGPRTTSTSGSAHGTSEVNNISGIGTNSGVTPGVARAGSIVERKVRPSTYQIAFLGLKILCVCFDCEISTEWIKIVRVIEELMNRNEGGSALWEFLEFVVSVRTALYPFMKPLISMKLSKSPANEQERGFKFSLREKMKEVTLGKCKGVLLMDIAHQMKQLKEDLNQKKEETLLAKKSTNLEANEGRRARPSLSDLFPGIAARFGAGSDDSNKTKHLNRESSVRVKAASQGTMMDRFMRRVSIAGDAPYCIPENTVLTKAREKSEEAIEIATEPDSHHSPSDDDGLKSHRLQRQKCQSRKTFRFRKSRRNNMGGSSVDEESESAALQPSSPSEVVNVTSFDVGGNGSPKQSITDKSSEAEDNSSETLKNIRQSTRSKSSKKNKRYSSGTSPNNNGQGDGDSQNSFSRTSSTCGYRDSFGSAEKFTLQMLERLEIPPKEDTETSKEKRKRRSRKARDDDDITLI